MDHKFPWTGDQHRLLPQILAILLNSVDLFGLSRKIGSKSCGTSTWMILMIKTNTVKSWTKLANLLCYIDLSLAVARQMLKLGGPRSGKIFNMQPIMVIDSIDKIEVFAKILSENLKSLVAKENVTNVEFITLK